MLPRMWERIQKILDRTESRLALYLTLGGSSVIGVITGWIASYSGWVSQFGAIGWWLTGLFGALVVAAIVLAALQSRYAYVRSRAIHGWKERVSDFNPMDSDFIKKRMNIGDIVDPVTNLISSKTFTNCDLLGPSIIAFLDNCSLAHVGFFNCNVFVVKENSFIRNAVALENVKVVGGRIANATILIQDHMVSTFLAMGSEITTYTKSESVQPLSPSKLEPEVQR